MTRVANSEHVLLVGIVANELNCEQSTKSIVEKYID